MNESDTKEERKAVQNKESLMGWVLPLEQEEKDPFTFEWRVSFLKEMQWGNNWFTLKGATGMEGGE